MGKIITVDSGKSGTGKTTVAAAVSSCIAMLGNKTLCIDFGTGLNNVSCTLGMDDKKYVKKIGVFKKQDWITEACCEHPGISGLFILTMSARFNMSKLCAPDMKLMFKKIRQKFDYCIIDTPPASFPGFKLAHADTDIAIVVTAGDLPIMYDVLMVTQFLHEAEINDVRLLINRVHPDNIEQMKTVVVNLLVKTGAKLTGFITVDDLFSQAGSLQDPQTAQHKQIMNKHFLSVARSLINETGVSDKVTASSLKKPAPIKLPTLPILQKPPIPPIPPIPPKPPMPPKPVLHVAEKNSKTAEPPNPASIESIPANFLGSYGDPTLWAQSTLNHVNIEDLVEIYAVTQGLLYRVKRSGTGYGFMICWMITISRIILKLEAWAAVKH